MSAGTPLRWFAPVPTRRLAIVRASVFGYATAWLVVRAGYLRDVATLPERRFEPVGVLDWLARPPSPGLVALVWVIAVAACSLAALGRWPRRSAPVGAVGVLLLATLASSYGQVFHTEHLLVLHLLVLAAGLVVDPPHGTETSGWPLNLMMSIVMLTYVLAGVAKLRWSGVGWVTGDILQNWIAVDNLRKVLVDDLYSPVGGWLSGIGWIWPPIAFATLLIELGAPAALARGRVRALWLAGAWGFHLGVFVLMAISFPYQLLGVAYLPFLPVESVVDWFRRRLVPRLGAGCRNPVTPLREDVDA